MRLPMRQKTRLRPHNSTIFVLGAFILCAALPPALSGCSRPRHGWGSKSAQFWLDLALEGETPDDRRDGINGLSRSSDGDAEWAVKVYDTVARTDTDAMVRCAALNAMSDRADGTMVSTVLKILKSREARFEDVRPASGPVRWEAAKLLLDIVHGMMYEPDMRDEIVSTLLECLAKDRDRNVRLTAIDALGYFAQEPVPTALIDVMESEEDYAMQHAAELSLMALTGKTFHHNAKAWRRWLNSVDDPFAHMGEIPADAYDE